MSSILPKVRFVFASEGLPKEMFTVADFKCHEGLSRPYSLEINLASDNPRLDFRKVLQGRGIFRIMRNEGSRVFQGYLSEFRQTFAHKDVFFYRATMVPKVWFLSLSRDNRVYLDKTAPEIITDALVSGGLIKGEDFDLRLNAKYDRVWEYVCQYGESYLNFAERWMEREGMYYFFEEGEHGSKMIITDSASFHADVSPGKKLLYSQPSGLDSTHWQEVVKNLSAVFIPLPQKLRLKDYNYRRPSLEMVGEAEVSAAGVGEVYIYGDHFRSPEEGAALAKIRAQQLKCQEAVFEGESSVPLIRPGFTFTLDGHFRDDFNVSYLTTEVCHEGSQRAALADAPSADLSGGSDYYFRNAFKAIPASVQFRPATATEKPRFSGCINARIDGATDGHYAEMDNHGRYKVRLPFDTSNRPGGKASAWFRMAQPYTGKNHGMHFPLHKGAEVILTFIDGDPDRPIIAGAVPNAENPSVVSGATASKGGFTTGGGSSLYAEDNQGGEHMVMRAGDNSSAIKLGSSSPPEFSVASSWQNTVVSEGLITFGGMIGNVSNIFSHSTITGWVWQQLLINVLSKFVLNQAAPLAAKIFGKYAEDLGKKAEKGEADPDQAQNTGNAANLMGGIVGIAQPIVTILTEVILGAVMAKVVSSCIAKRTPDTLGISQKIEKSCYVVANVNEGTFCNQKKGGDNILFAAAKGSFISYAHKDFQVITDEKVTFNAGDEYFIKTPKDFRLEVTQDIKAETRAFYAYDDDFFVRSANRVSLFSGSKDKTFTPCAIGIHLEASSSHDISIKNADGNTDGKIEIKSNNVVSVKKEENEVSVGKYEAANEGVLIKAAGGKKIEIKAGSNTITIDGEKVEINLDSSAKFSVIRGGSNFHVYDGIELNAPSDNVTVNGQKVSLA